MNIQPYEKQQEILDLFLKNADKLAWRFRTDSNSLQTAMCKGMILVIYTFFNDQDRISSKLYFYDLLNDCLKVNPIIRVDSFATNNDEHTINFLEKFNEKMHDIIKKYRNVSIQKIERELSEFSKDDK